MKRAKLPGSAPLPAGSMPPTSTWYEIPRCFACDDPIKSHRFSTSLLLGHTQYSHSSIPGKLGEYIGEGFVVVVTSEDALCRNCMNLLNTMDRLEEELKDHRTRLVGNLRRKYGLDPGGIQPVPRISRKQQIKVDDDDDVIEIQSDEEWTPYNKKRKVTPTNISRTKTMCCNVCKMEFTDLNRFMTHLKQHRDQKEGMLLSADTKVESNISKIFKCGCCTMSFDKKEALANHMRLHTAEKQLIRPTGVTSSGDTVSLLKTNANSATKLYPKPTSQTVVEMKLIMDAAHKPGSTIATKESPPLEKPVTVTKVTEKDTGGKVCLLALWNSGSCTDHADCQNPSCGSESHSIPTQQTQVAVSQGETLTPRILLKPDGVPQVVVSQSEPKKPDYSQARFRITPAVGKHSNISAPKKSQADTRIVTIPQTANAPTHIPVSVKASSPPLSHIVVSIPNQGSDEVILNTSDNILPKGAVQNSDLDQKIVLPISNIKEESPSTFQTQLSCEVVKDNSVENNSLNEAMKSNKSMPSLDLEPVNEERTIIEHDEMGNIAIVNVSGVQESETTYKGDDTDWFLASQQSNSVLEPPHTLWGNQDSIKSEIDQVDGMRSSSTLPLEAREQSDSVDEDEKSEYFTSRYVVDTKTRLEAEALADAIFAAIKS